VFEGKQIRRFKGTRFLGVWVDAELKWRGQVDQVAGKLRRLLGVLGRTRADLDEHLLISLYNSMVLPHPQYCLMVWGNFEADRNKAQGGIIAGKGGCYNADPLFARYGILKVEDLYLQQLRMHAWKFHSGRLPDSQAAMLSRVGKSHGYGT
jgi:hypothetical protein